ncbi:MAG: hypothetical protein IT349_19410 [Candidatus Eisenbacteria bacterium]|nr:hypothetical protein [Candidatus Eisenbacteria bacterium]
MATYNVKSKFQIVAELPDVVVLEDLDGKCSVTNDAERVVRHLANVGLKDRHLIYRDTDGVWDELLHDGSGTFKGFRLIGAELLNDALRAVRGAT